METKTVKVDAVEPDISQIKDAVGLIDDGKLVAFPTETVYGIACRLESSSLAELGKLKGRSPEKYYTLHIGSKGDIEKYVPAIGLRAQKLIEEFWPGPLTIVFALDDQDIDEQRGKFAKEVFENLYIDNSIGIRCPDNVIASMLLRESKSSVVAPSANIGGQKPATNAEEVTAQLSGQIELVLDGGQCKYKNSSTVVKVSGGVLEVLREGVYSKEELEKASEIKILFVCTGNTCRSPMAGGIFGKYLAEKSGCNVDQFGEIGYKVSSAGTMGMVGAPASAEAVVACAKKGVDIKRHKSSALTKKLIDESDFIFAMTRSHKNAVVTVSSEAANKCLLLADKEDVADPIGQSQEVYDNCAELIEAAVKKRISELKI